MCYLFCNGFLIRDENHPINSDSIVKVKFFQTKREDSFSSDTALKLKDGIEQIFNLDLSLDELKANGANDDILSKTDLIRKIFRKTQKERGRFYCEVFYATEALELNIPTKISLYEQQLRDNPLKIPIKFEYWGAQELLDLIKTKDEALEIKFDTQIVNILQKGINISGTCGFVKGNDLMSCLIDKENGFKSHLTEGNVRYFLGEDKTINSSIIDTAKNEDKASIFWAMNNGITIIGQDVRQVDATVYSIKNPQIVNGCQTIHCLHSAFTSNNKNKLPENLKVFVKLIQTGDDINIQSDIISATNSQNAVKGASLKANDNIQKNIESHLKKFGFYYERRENYYKQRGISGTKVIGLLKMAQIVHTIVNKESITAMNDTATLFTHTRYKTIFHNVADYDLYLFCVKLFQRVWTFKNSDLRKKDYPREKKEIMSKAGFILLNIISSLMFSEAEFIEKRELKREKCISDFDIKAPVRKNKFTLRKKWLFEKLNDENYMVECFNNAKKIYDIASRNYSVANPDKPTNSFLKNRTFDREFLRPIISRFIDKEFENVGA
jgi:hypothetical protein